METDEKVYFIQAPADPGLIPVMEWYRPSNLRTWNSTDISYRVILFQARQSVVRVLDTRASISTKAFYEIHCTHAVLELS